jgi:hypothetical protein
LPFSVKKKVMPQAAMPTAVTLVEHPAATQEEHPQVQPRPP